MKKGKFTSVWGEGTITTPATLNDDNSIETDSVECDFEDFIEEFFEDEDGEIYEVCPDCHSYILVEDICPKCDEK